MTFLNSGISNFCKCLGTRTKKFKHEAISGFTMIAKGIGNELTLYVGGIGREREEGEDP